MSFEETTRKMADEVAALARRVAAGARDQGCELRSDAIDELRRQVGDLASAVAKLADCVSRRFTGTPDAQLANVRHVKCPKCPSALHFDSDGPGPANATMPAFCRTHNERCDDVTFGPGDCAACAKRAESNHV